MLHSGHAVHVLEVDIIRTGGEFTTVLVHGVGSESLLNDIVPVKFLDGVEVVGETLSVEADSELVVNPEVLTLALNAVPLLRVVPPEGELQVPGNVVGVDADVITELGDTRLWVALAASERGPNLGWGLCHLGRVGFLDDFTVGEEMRSDLIEGIFISHTHGIGQHTINKRVYKDYP